MNQATMASMPLGIGPAPPVFGIQPNYVPAPAQIACKRCQYPGCDIKVSDCGCFLHARCMPVQKDSPVTHCPGCGVPVRSLLLMPMNFDEIDEAKASAAAMSPSVKRGKKRKNATIARLNPTSSSSVEEGAEGADLRTGRWTTEETLYCDKLIEKFQVGELPVADGMKLNDFLATMLKSKQSRLTKKMKNARLSAKTYNRTHGHIRDVDDAKEFSQLERQFYDSIQCDMERAEIRFHMQKEWRELFSSFCVAMGQRLDADGWLSSVEEMDRRVSQAKDAARMARRKVMMGYALSQDSRNQERGVFIEHTASHEETTRSSELLSSHASSNSLIGDYGQKKQRNSNNGEVARPLRDFSSPFVGKVVQYIQRHSIPFEHIDAWVPSFVANGGEQQQQAVNPNQKCRLCFAGFASTGSQIPPDGGRLVPLSAQDKFDLLSFGEYSSKFSFDVGCGLPGRVYSSGICSWEQGVENAPSQQFERCGGASQWGIKTVLGIPIPSPNVGRIVVLLYSRHDRKRDTEMVRRITEELTKLMPTPKWKLVVDVGAKPPKPDNAAIADRRVADLLKLLAEHIPTHRNSPYSPYLPGFTSLRLLLLKQTKTPEEKEMLSTVLESYSSYLSSGRSNSETAWMIARDFMLLSRTNTTTANAAARPQQGGTTQATQQIPSLLQHHVSLQHHASQLVPAQPGQPLQQQASKLAVQPAGQQLHSMQPFQGQVQQLQEASRLLQSQSQNSIPQQQALSLQQQQEQQQSSRASSNQQISVGSSLQSQQPKQSFLLEQGYGSLTGATQPSQLALNQASRNLAPSPGFTLQQSAFHPITQTPGSNQQQQSNVEA